MLENFFDKKSQWYEVLQHTFSKPYFQELSFFLENEYKNTVVYPPKEKIFNAFEKTSFDSVKVLILGQDPYHNKGQAHGLAFSVEQGKIPPSLKNIFKELHRDCHVNFVEHGNLTSWAKQGVLLLNTCLTVREAHANSHAKKGWEIFTDEVLRVLNKKNSPIVFLLWGNNAKEKARLIVNKNHYILDSAHPSPLSANKGFHGNCHFSKTNDFLRKNQLKEIDWQI